MTCAASVRRRGAEPSDERRGYRREGRGRSARGRAGGLRSDSGADRTARRAATVTRRHDRGLGRSHGLAADPSEAAGGGAGSARYLLENSSRSVAGTRQGGSDGQGRRIPTPGSDGGGKGEGPVQSAQPRVLR